MLRDGFGPKCHRLSPAERIFGEYWMLKYVLDLMAQRLTSGACLCIT